LMWPPPSQVIDLAAAAASRTQPTAQAVGGGCRRFANPGRGERDDGQSGRRRLRSCGPTWPPPFFRRCRGSGDVLSRSPIACARKLWEEVVANSRTRQGCKKLWPLDAAGIAEMRSYAAPAILSPLPRLWRCSGSFTHSLRYGLESAAATAAEIRKKDRHHGLRVATVWSRITKGALSR
jgi:hypothetical protein